ncbi:unnamed protein product [Ambrosiozyma monospora]|uniref:Unnamed protein product n=1 Tax=Ambrosiozyma monospora TaxID=43982 RepID=A0ACB5SVQ4_AMBMO|nr:unnamed protein product [Ambrosiozyma monospora]
MSTLLVDTHRVVDKPQKMRRNVNVCLYFSSWPQADSFLKFKYTDSCVARPFSPYQWYRLSLPHLDNHSPQPPMQQGVSSSSSAMDVDQLSPSTPQSPTPSTLGTSGNSAAASSSLSKQQQQSKTKKFNRGRSSRACVTCNKRKVRCDVIKKDYPREKCTNCQEFGVECILTERRRKKDSNNSNKDGVSKTPKRSSHSHSSVNTKLTQSNLASLSAASPISVTSPQGIFASEDGVGMNSDANKFYHLVEQKNAILVDKEHTYRNRFTRKSHGEHFKNITPTFFMKLAIQDYMTSSDGFKFSDSEKLVMYSLTFSSNNSTLSSIS